jgi:hypothetical protein
MEAMFSRCFSLKRKRKLGVKLKRAKEGFVFE